MNNPLNIYPIFSNYLLSRWISMFIWSICMFLLALMFTGLYESFSGEIDRMAETAPAALEAVWGGNLAYASTPEGWLGLELYGLMLPIVLSIVGVAAGASAIGNEEDSGTLELLLASPISRVVLISQKYGAAGAQIFIVAFSVWIGVMVGTWIFPFDVSLRDVLSASVMAWLLGFLSCSVTLLAQSVRGHKSVAISAGATFVAVSYVADILPKLIDSLSALKWVSVFFYYNGPDVLLNGIKPTYMAVIVVACVLIFALAAWMFNKRDTGT